MREIRFCNKADCRLPAIHDSDTCWEHLHDKDGYRNEIEQGVVNSREYHNAVFVGAGLAGLNLAGMIANNADFTGADLYNVIFAGADLRWSKFDRCRFNYTSLDRADFSFASMNYCIGKTLSAIGADFEGAEMRYCTFTDANFQDANLSNSNWQGSIITSCDLSRINGYNWHAPRVNLEDSILTKANLEFAVLGGSLMDGVKAAQTNFRRTNLIGVSARNADFQLCGFYYARLTSGCFDRADFSDSDLTRAVLRSVTFFAANLNDVIMDNAVLDRAKFSN